MSPINAGVILYIINNLSLTSAFSIVFVFNNDELEVVEEKKLLGVVLRSDLSWGANTEYMVKRANRKLWCLRRLKKLGARRSDLIDVYIKQIRSLLEFAVSRNLPYVSSWGNNKNLIDHPLKNCS